MIPQTGLLFKYSPTDYLTGSLPTAEVNPTGDWRDYLPADEKQFKDFKFDTLSCTTFSAINCIETQINFFLKNKKFTLSQELLLNDYILDGKVNFSDRFTAIMSGTSKQGNYFQNVWDSIRKDGLLPEKDLPFGGDTWEEYHNPNVITEAMKTKAKKILELLSFAYEWVTFEPDKDLSQALKQAPLHGAIPFPAYHAVELPSANFIYDTYNPFLYERMVKVHYTLKGIVTIKAEPVSTTYKYFSKYEVAKWKLKPELFALLDKMRGECGFPFVITSGLRTKAENDALKDSVSDSSHLSGLAVDLSCTDSTKRFKLIDVALKNGINRIGVAKTFIHLDISKTLPQGVIWTY